MNKLNGKGIKVFSAFGQIMTTIIWGSAFVVMKNSVEVITPAYLLAMRFTIASAALVAVFWKRVRKIRKTDIMCGGLLGLLLFCPWKDPLIFG